MRPPSSPRSPCLGPCHLTFATAHRQIRELAGSLSWTSSLSHIS
jgi:hypothetical protein